MVIVMWLEKITIENIRSIQRAEVPLRKMNIFIGANSSAKSSVIDAIITSR